MFLEQQVWRVGIVADTHVPDRASSLHPRLLPSLRAEKVDGIWHCGDVCVPSVLRELSEVAPVTAVRGNRDWLLRGELPGLRRFDVMGVRVVLIHGQGNLVDYLLDKVATLLWGYQLERYQRAMRIAIMDAQVVVFGHTHYPVNLREGNCLWFNPGSATVGASDRPPGFGVLEFSTMGQVGGQIIPLEGAKLVGRTWKSDEYPMRY